MPSRGGKTKKDLTRKKKLPEKKKTWSQITSTAASRDVGVGVSEKSSVAKWESLNKTQRRRSLTSEGPYRRKTKKTNLQKGLTGTPRRKPYLCGGGSSNPLLNTQEMPKAPGKGGEPLKENIRLRGTHTADKKIVPSGTSHPKHLRPGSCPPPGEKTFHRGEQRSHLKLVGGGECLRRESRLKSGLIQKRNRNGVNKGSLLKKIFVQSKGIKKRGS